MFNARGRQKTLGLAVTEQGITAVLIGPSAGGGGKKRLRLPSGKLPSGLPSRTVLRTAELPFSKEVGLGDPAKLGQELRKVLHDNDMLGGGAAGRCVIGLAASWIATREKSLPPASGESLRAALAIAAEREFASGPADLAFDYTAQLGPQGVSALLVAAPRRIVDQLLAMAKVAGLSLTGVTCSALALAMRSEMRSGIGAAPAPPGERLVLCLLPRGVELVVLSASSQGPRLIRHLPVSLNQSQVATGELAGALRRILSQAPAENASTELLIWDSIGLDHGQPQLAHLLENELGLPPGRPGSPGSSARLCDLEADLELTWLPSLPSRNPKSDAALAAFVPGSRLTGKFAQAAALACLAGQGDSLAIDFTHSRLSPPVKARIGRRVALAAAAALLLIAAGVWYYLDWQARQEQVAKLQQQLDGMKDSTKVAQSLVDDVTFAQTWFDHRPPFEKCWAAISRAFPPPKPGPSPIWATSLVIKEDMEATLTGLSVDRKTALDLEKGLGSNPRLANVKLKNISQMGGNSTDWTFTITLSYRGAP